MIQSLKPVSRVNAKVEVSLKDSAEEQGGMEVRLHRRSHSAKENAVPRKVEKEERKELKEEAVKDKMGDLKARMKELKERKKERAERSKQGGSEKKYRFVEFKTALQKGQEKEKEKKELHSDLLCEDVLRN